jgi:hopene-associated glycosyltransferase HpnB
MLGIAVATSVALFAWLWLAVARGSFWRSQPRLPAAGTARAWPSVTVVVPARDEAAQLPATLPALLAQDYAGQLRVIVVDDRSTDGTAAVASQLGADDPRLTVLAGRPAPPGWVGKVWALEQGVAAAGATEWLLFTDADIAHGSRVVSRLVSFAQSADKDMVSVMALLRCRDPWERLIVPAFVYFFAMLYPFRWVGRGRTAAAAAS